MNRKRLIELLKKAKKNGKTATKIAEELNISNAQLTHWCKGIRNPASDSLQKLANYFGVSVDYLLEDDGAEGKNITANNNTQSTVTQIDNSNANIKINANNADYSQNEKELIKIFRDLNFRSQIKVITYAYSVKDQEKE